MQAETPNKACWKWQVVDAIHTEHGAESVSVVSCFKTVVEMRLGARLDDSEVTVIFLYQL